MAGALVLLALAAMALAFNGKSMRLLYGTGLARDCSCTPKKAADSRLLHNAVAPQSRPKTRLLRLQVRTRKVSCLPSVFVVLKGFKIAKCRYSRFSTKELSLSIFDG